MSKHKFQEQITVKRRAKYHDRSGTNGPPQGPMSSYMCKKMRKDTESSAAGRRSFTAFVFDVLMMRLLDALLPLHAAVGAGHAVRPDAELCEGHRHAVLVTVHPGLEPLKSGQDFKKFLFKKIFFNFLGCYHPLRPTNPIAEAPGVEPEHARLLGHHAGEQHVLQLQVLHPVRVVEQRAHRLRSQQVGAALAKRRIGAVRVDFPRNKAGKIYKSLRLKSQVLKSLTTCSWGRGTAGAP